MLTVTVVAAGTGAKVRSCSSFTACTVTVWAPAVCQVKRKGSG
jgi:hypothetical protein